MANPEVGRSLSKGSSRNGQGAGVGEIIVIFSEFRYFLTSSCHFFGVQWSFETTAIFSRHECEKLRQVLGTDTGGDLSSLCSIANFLGCEIWSNVVDQAGAYPGNLGGFFHDSIDKRNALDDFGQPLAAV